MALMECPECQRQVSDKAAACPHCGHPIAARNDYPRGLAPSDLTEAVRAEPRTSKETAQSEKRARKEAARQEKHARRELRRSEGGRIGIGSFLTIMVVLGVLISWGIKTDRGPQAQHSDVDPENKLHDLTRDQGFLARNPDFLDITRRLIVAHGYDCPRINILWAKGPSPFGSKLEAFCGPVSGTGIYEALHYAVYPEQFRVAICKANGVFSNGCE